MSPDVELIYSRDCPNVGLARERLTEALTACGLPTAWVEWQRQNPEAPEYARLHGSPTVLINGRDVAPSAETDSDNCRIYATPGGIDRAPSLGTLVEALSNREPEG